MWPFSKDEAEPAADMPEPGGMLTFADRVSDAVSGIADSAVQLTADAQLSSWPGYGDLWTYEPGAGAQLTDKGVQFGLLALGGVGVYMLLRGR